MNQPENSLRSYCVSDFAAATGYVEGAQLPDRKMPVWLFCLVRHTGYSGRGVLLCGQLLPLDRMQELKERAHMTCFPRGPLRVKEPWWPAHTGQGSHPEMCPSPQSIQRSHRGDRHPGDWTVARDSPASHFLYLMFQGHRFGHGCITIFSNTLRSPRRVHLAPDPVTYLTILPKVVNR